MDKVNNPDPYMLMKQQSIDIGAGNNTKSVTLSVPESIEKLANKSPDPGFFSAREFCHVLQVKEYRDGGITEIS